MARKTKEYYQNIVGKTFGKLTIKNYFSNGKMIMVNCSCVCGNKVIRRLSAVVDGSNKSCGCLYLKGSQKVHGMCRTSFYSIWAGMKSRCNNPKNVMYHYYGGRGITHDPKWSSFKEFKKDMFWKYVYASKKYRKEINKKNNMLSIERIDVDGGYNKMNCIFIPKNHQASNTRKNKEFIAINLATGERVKHKNQRGFAREYGVHHRSISKVLNGHILTTGGWRFKYLNN